MATSTADDDEAAARIDAVIAGLRDWRGEALSRVRALIQKADLTIDF